MIGDVVWNFGTIHSIGQRILLQARLRGIDDGARAQAHDAIAKCESLNVLSDLAHDSDDILA
jgi:hypothetical protein